MLRFCDLLHRIHTRRLTLTGISREMAQNLTPDAKKPRRQHVDRIQFDPEKAETILQAMTMGKGLGKVLEEVGLSPTVFYRWLSEPGFREKYTDARKVQAEIMATEIIQIADDASNDTFVDADGRVRLDNAAVARARLRVDTRKWILSKVLPKVYGDKVALTDADGQNLKVDLSWLKSRAIGQVIDVDVTSNPSSKTGEKLLDSITYEGGTADLESAGDQDQTADDDSGASK